MLRGGDGGVVVDGWGVEPRDGTGCVGEVDRERGMCLSAQPPSLTQSPSITPF